MPQQRLLILDESSRFEIQRNRLQIGRNGLRSL